MKRHLLLFLLLPAACAQPEGPPAAADANPAAPAAEPAPAASTDALGGYHWRLSEATAADGSRIEALFADPERPLQLDFADGRVGVSGGCNRIGGQYAIEGDTLRVEDLQETLMACDPPLMRQDEAIGTRLQGGLQLRIQESDPPTLILTAANGDTLRLVGEATADSRYGGPGETVFLEVAAARAPCSHPLIPDMQCLQVREVQYDAQGIKTGEPGEWQPLYQEIEGYTHEPGIGNVLRLKRYQIANPPADAPSVAYVLDMVVESRQEAASAAEE